MTDDEKEALCIEMARHGLVEPGEKQAWRCTLKGHTWGSALIGIAMAQEFNGEPIAQVRH